MLGGKKAVQPSRVARRLGLHTRTVQRWCRQSVQAPDDARVHDVHVSGSGRYWIPRGELDRLTGGDR